MPIQITRSKSENKYFSDLRAFEAFFPYGECDPNTFWLKILPCKMLIDGVLTDVNAVKVPFGRLHNGTVSGYSAYYTYFEVASVVVLLPSTISITMPEG